MHFDLVRPVLRQNSARLHAWGSNPSPASAAISSKALSIISCRSSRLSFTSIVLLTPAHWQHQVRGREGARWLFFVDWDWLKCSDYLWLKSPGANRGSRTRIQCQPVQGRCLGHHARGRRTGRGSARTSRTACLRPPKICNQLTHPINAQLSFRAVRFRTSTDSVGSLARTLPINLPITLGFLDLALRYSDQRPFGSLWVRLLC